MWYPFRLLWWYTFQLLFTQYTESMVRIWNTAPQMGHFLRISYFAWAILLYIIRCAIRLLNIADQSVA